MFCPLPDPVTRPLCHLQVEFSFRRHERSQTFTFVEILQLISNIIECKLKLLYIQRSSDGQVKSTPKVVEESFEEEEDEHGDTLCGSCGGNYSGDEFWIGCDICERWYHGKCVKITPAKAESIKQYKCPYCTKRNRPQCTRRERRTGQPITSK